MLQAPREKDSTADGDAASSSRVPGSVLFAALSVLAILPAIWFGASHYIEYDGYWHIFAARQDRWNIFWREVFLTAHPPLFFLLLKAVSFLGDFKLVYRSISLLTAIGASYLMARIVERLTSSVGAGILALCAFGLSLDTLSVAIEVRSYMLCTFFSLAAFAALLELVPRAGAPPQRKHRMVFALAATAAVLSHYGSALFLAACSGSALLAVLADRQSRGAWAARPRRELIADLLTAAPPVATFVAAYFIHIRPFSPVLAGPSPDFYDPSAGEDPRTFLLRNLRRELELFLPWSLRDDSVFAASLLLLAVCGLVTVLRRQSARQAIPAVAAAILLVIHAAASLLHAYPFGGQLRHQYLLFPLLIATASLLVWQLCFRLVRPSRRGVALVVLAAALAFIGGGRIRREPLLPQTLLTDEMTVFRSLVPRPDAVFLDRFNLIVFFMHHSGDSWHFESRNMDDRFYVWKVGSGAGSFHVVHLPTTWNLLAQEAHTYHDISDALSFVRTRSVSVFSVHQGFPRAPEAENAKALQKIRTLAADAGLATEVSFEDGAALQATFAPVTSAAVPRNCTAAARVILLFPAGTPAGKRFQVVQSGLSAMSVVGKGFRPSAVVRVNGRPLLTTFGNGEYLTALVPDELYAEPGSLGVSVINPDGCESNAAYFRVGPK